VHAIIPLNKRLVISLTTIAKKVKPVHFLNREKKVKKSVFRIKKQESWCNTRSCFKVNEIEKAQLGCA